MTNKLSHRAEENTSAPMPKALKTIEKKIEKRLNTLCNQVIRANHAIGLMLIEATKKFKPLSKYPFRDIIAWFGEDLRLHPRHLYECKRFAERVSSDDLELLVQPPINWSHIQIILNHDLDHNLEHWVGKVVDNGWTACDLQEEVRAGRPNLREGSGRRPSPPKSARAGLQQLEKSVKKLQNKMDHALFSTEFDLAEEIRTMPPDDVGTQTRESVEHAAVIMEQLGEVILQNARGLRDTLTWLNVILKRREAEEQQKEQEKWHPTTRIPNFSDGES